MQQNRKKSEGGEYFYKTLYMVSSMRPIVQDSMGLLWYAQLGSVLPCTGVRAAQKDLNQQMRLARSYHKDRAEEDLSMSMSKKLGLYQSKDKCGG